jgi:hypothetical protein
MYRREQHLREEYFPPTKSSRANESLAQAADKTKAEKLKPLLLLVEDKEINLQVTIPKSLFAHYSRPFITGIRTYVGKASRRFHKEE